MNSVRDFIISPVSSSSRNLSISLKILVAVGFVSVFATGP
jgi:hypothetical protein